MSFWEDDISNFFGDFAIAITLHPGASNEIEIDVIFDEAQELYDLQTGQVVNAGPAITCKSSDASEVSIGDQMIINGTTYYARAILDDGTGITKITVSTK